MTARHRARTSPPNRPAPSSRPAQAPQIDGPDPAIDAPTIRTAAAGLALELQAAQAQQLAAFAALLLKWNAVHNLTALREPGAVLTHHLLDTLALVPMLERIVPAEPFTLLDVGSGGGLPAIPVAICCPRAAVTALDAVEKKIAFLQHARAELKLSNLAVVHARVESWTGGPFDVITARAFASLADLVALSRHLLRPDGLWLALKGKVPDAELAALPADVEHLATVKLAVPRLDEQRHLILLAPRTPASSHLSRAAAAILQRLAGLSAPDSRAQHAHLDT